ncbi:MAG: ammonium transporter, partial [Bacteroidaceae bacterium]|nr:ammonium transporter [Bacteroidaceae bacterium]
GAVSVHGVGGFLGTVLCGVFCNPAIDGVELAGGSRWSMIGIEALGAFVVAAFAFVCGMAMFLVIKHTHGLRCDRRIEEEGLDIYEHGETAYNN